MPKRIPEQELDAILAVVSAHPGGVGVRTIREGLPFALRPRTLQRRLALLVEQQRLVAEGRGKGRRYRAPVTGKASVVLGDVAFEGRGEVYLPISPEAEVIKQAIRAPIQERQPVGYRRDFLDDYRPNETCYIPAETRRHLHELGRPPDRERPAGTYARTIYGRLLIDLSWNSRRLEGNT